MDLIWHKNDIRMKDNQSVHNSQEGIPLYVFDDRILEYGDARRTKWIIKNIKNLKSDYRDKGSDLIIRVGESPEVIEDIINEFDIGRVLSANSYTKIGMSRDKAVKNKLNKNNVEFKRFHDTVMHEPESIFTNKGDPYSVFTYYHKKWKKREKDEPYKIPNDLHRFSDERDVPTIQELGFNDIEISLPRSGNDAAIDVLDNFVHNRIYDYQDERDYPNKNVTSRLSPYLSYGIVGVRDVWKATQDAKKEADNVDSVEAYQEQLAWRDFYHQVMYHNPELTTENYKDYENDIKWRDDSEELERWKNGTTGYPIVDAGMRQLEEEGWMHNRVRMIVASFLTKDLLIDWRHGYNWFKKMLIDHNAPNNNGGWQWAASTGTDAQPYFRIFNPMTQGEDYDSNAEYIKKYVPELKDVEPDKIHVWNELSDKKRNELAPSYNHPVIDHSERREEALEMFRKARGDD